MECHLAAPPLAPLYVNNISILIQIDKKTYTHVFLSDPPLFVSLLSSVGGITFSSSVLLALLVLFLALALALGLANLALLSK